MFSVFFHYHTRLCIRTLLPRSLTLPPLRPKVIVNQELKARHSLTLSVLCYNILAQDLIERNMCLYSQRMSYHLDWVFRKKNIIMELEKQNADVC